MNTTRLLTALQLANELRLPASWLKTEANAGRIPSLRIGRRLLFNSEAVVQVLMQRAAQETSDGAKTAEGATQ